MVRVGILGASGYGGAELLRLLKAHPEVELVGFSSRKYEGRPLEAAWPQLWDGRLFAAQEEVLERAEVVFLALPNGLSMEIAPEALKAGKRVVDLSGDFRLPPEVYEAWYRIPHKSPDLYREAVYGLPERFTTEDHTTAWTTERLVGSRRDDIKIRYGIGYRPTCDETGDVTTR